MPAAWRRRCGSPPSWRGDGRAGHGPEQIRIAPMPVNDSIFREYDIRGVAEVDFDARFAHDLGRAYAAYLADAGHPDAAPARRGGVGRDGRLTSDGYAGALRQGLRSAGIDVVDLGTCPTPVVYFSLFDLDLAGAIQVTGSHNPASDNGFKVCVGRSTIHGEQIQRLRELIGRTDAPAGEGGETQVDILARYRRDLIARFGRLARPLRVVVDAGNGTAGP